MVVSNLRPRGRQIISGGWPCRGSSRARACSRPVPSQPVDQASRQASTTSVYGRRPSASSRCCHWPVGQARLEASPFRAASCHPPLLSACARLSCTTSSHSPRSHLFHRTFSSLLVIFSFPRTRSRKTRTRLPLVTLYTMALLLCLLGLCLPCRCASRKRKTNEVMQSGFKVGWEEGRTVGRCVGSRRDGERSGV